MPAPKRTDPDDFFARLESHQRAHLEELRRISLSFAPEVAEELRWNTPAYIRDGENMWMLQAFGKHCSLRFTPDFFTPMRDEVTAAGYDSGAGFLKLPYDREIPEDLCRRLIAARLAPQ
ncbi:iron chaperone [Gulosibacter faecalis]|jgi:uncharacterized protein YdhG (YjbR/CyaY superfamily)|uniref:Iron chaperone n=1 Tax=Gulosibacter faecalis TaxID=272240 RepID=A0ABW5V0X5_9MICO|nr:DUF1801 domain-containing protein [Gulosibacter faecalis]